MSHAGHRAGGRDKKLLEELRRLGVTPGEEAVGCGKMLDNIYDALSAQLRDAIAKLEPALK